MSIDPGKISQFGQSHAATSSKDQVFASSATHAFPHEMQIFGVFDRSPHIYPDLLRIRENFLAFCG